MCAWTDKGDADFGANLCEGVILGEETIARMNGIGSSNLCCGDDGGNVEITFASRCRTNTDSFICESDME